MYRKLLITFAILFIAFFSEAQCPTLSVSPSDTIYCQNDILEFTLSGAPAGSSIFWNLGSGYDSSGTTYSTTLSASGMIDVIVRVILPDGTICNHVEYDIARIVPALVPAFSASRQILCSGPDTVTLTDQTPNSISRNWIVNGNPVSNAAKAQIVYIGQSGANDLTLVTSDQYGCRFVATFEDTIEVYSDINLSIAKSNTTDFCVPYTTNFSSSYSTGQTIDSVRWDLPGSSSPRVYNNNATGINYNISGQYSATFSVFSASGCVYTVSDPEFVEIGDIDTLDLSISKTELCVSERAEIIETVQPLIGRLTWQINASTIIDNGRYSRTVAFRDTGYFSIGMELDYFGCISTFNLDSAFYVKGVTGDFISDLSFHCDTPITVDFTNETDSTLTGLSFEWLVTTVDDSVFYQSTDKDISLEFDSFPANYNVTLITEDSEGCIDSLKRTNYIRLQPYDVRVSGLRPGIACVQQNIRTLTSTPKGSSLGPDYYRWTYFDKDGSIYSVDSNKQGRVTYSDTGIYSIQLLVENDYGCRDSAFFSDTLQVIDPEVLFSISDTAICLGDSFQVKGMGQPSEASFSYSWRFKNLETNFDTLFVGDSLYANLPDVGVYELTVYQTVFNQCEDSAKTKVYINGVRGEILLDSAAGCSPFTIRPDFKVLDNTYIEGSDSAILFNWFVTPEVGTSIIGASTSDPAITFAGPGDYEISVFLTNSSGCGNYNKESSNVLVGVDAWYISSVRAACKNEEIRILNQSSTQATSYQWQVNPSGTYTIDTVDNQTFEFSFDSAGRYQITLIVGKDSQCYDTVSKPYNIFDIQAGFEATDSLLYCAPQSTTLINRSVNADSLLYIFDNGDRFRTDTAASSYTFQNNGWHSASLIAYNNIGCRDSIYVDSFLQILGPVPNFDIDFSQGCNPLTVEFTDLSEMSNKLVFDYGDGNLDSVGPFTNTYVVNNNQAYQDFIPSLTVHDSLGCSETLVFDSMIRVYELPDTQSVIGPARRLCQNSWLYFNNSGTYVDSIIWSLDGTPISNDISDSFRVVTYGLRDLSMMVFNDYGCLDSTRYSFEVQEVPPLTLIIDSTACLNSPYVASGYIPGSLGVANYNWNFGEPGNPDNIQTTGINQTSIQYQNFGPKLVYLQIELVNSCTAEDSAQITVLDPNGITPLDLDLVSVHGSGSIEMSYPQVNYPYFNSYRIYRNDSLVYTESKVDSLYWLDTKLLKGPDNYCYHITVTDLCNNETQKINQHCPVILDATSTVHKQNQLNWTPYEGWNAIQGYEIYRTDEAGNSSFLAQVPSSTVSYIDSPLCPANFTYQVYAISDPGALISRSNTDDQIPLYIPNTVNPNVRVVSVTELDEIELDWPASAYDGFDHFEIIKYENDFNTEVQVFTSTQTSLVDPDVSTSEISYIYEVIEIDDCDSITLAGRYGKSIVLSGNRLETSTALTWTAYNLWANGVEKYEVLVKESTGYKVVGSVPGTQLNFQDFGVHEEDAEGRYRYKVRAINIDGDTSYSNLIYVTGGPIVFVPNAFSPNNDGINDEFSISTVFVKNSSEIKPTDFHINIYNRWGQLVYQSNNRDFSWDGTYEGVDVQQGVYFYLIKYTESEGFKSYGKGTLTLLR